MCYVGDSVFTSPLIPPVIYDANHPKYKIKNIKKTGSSNKYILEDNLNKYDKVFRIPRYIIRKKTDNTSSTPPKPSPIDKFTINDKIIITPFNLSIADLYNLKSPPEG